MLNVGRYHVATVEIELLKMYIHGIVSRITEDEICVGVVVKSVQPKNGQMSLVCYHIYHVDKYARYAANTYVGHCSLI